VPVQRLGTVRTGQRGGLDVTIGSVEWFHHRMPAIIDHARAIDDLRSAALSFKTLVARTPTGAVEAKGDGIDAALHAAGVVSYARPFVGDRPISLKLIGKRPNFRRDVHDQLITLRHKLIAHSDRKFADARLLLKKITINVGEAPCSELVQSAYVMVRALHAPSDPRLGGTYLTQSEAAAQGAVATIHAAMSEYAETADKFPLAFTEFSKRDPSQLPASEFEFPLSPVNPDAVIPDNPPSAENLLALPPLEIGKDGYFYRILATSVEKEHAFLKVQLPDGQQIDLDISWRQKIDR
jgi:hypothetical protein